MSNPSFKFVILTDTHIRIPREATGPDDYPSNKVFNSRNQFVISQINRLAPDFVIHLGDITHSIPALPDFKPAMNLAVDMYQQLAVKLYVTPGNHDVGDKPNAWTPAPAVDEDSHTIFESLWGKTYQSFDHEGCHFVFFNSQVLNSGLLLEKDQWTWLEHDLAANQRTGSRVFIFTHYPLFINQFNENEHYDNIGRPARTRLLSLLEKFNVEAVFSGHVHHFFYNRYLETDLYVLPSVAFVRPEFSEMFHTAPQSEFGRNDAEKLGFTIVKVDQSGYRCIPVRTHGLSEIGEDSVAVFPYIPPGGRDELPKSPVGFSMRHSWAPIQDLPFDNLDEFIRKRVRNDYPLLAWWELGIQKMRVPISDLADKKTRARMLALQDLGYNFTVFSIGVPDEHHKKILCQFSQLIFCWEVILPEDLLQDAIQSIQLIKKEAAVRTVLSKLDTLVDHQNNPEFYFSHFPSHGFHLDDQDLILTWTDDENTSGLFDGFVFSVPPGEHPWEGIKAASSTAKEMKTNAVVHLQMPRSSEGVDYNDDRAISNRIAETLMAAISVRNVEVYIDTFIDHDRGYYPRNGILDRRFNPRPAYYVYRHLWHAIRPHISFREGANSQDQITTGSKSRIGRKASDSILSYENRRFFTLNTPQYSFSLLIDDIDGSSNPILTIESLGEQSIKLIKRMDLVTGKGIDIPWNQSSEDA